MMNTLKRILSLSFLLGSFLLSLAVVPHSLAQESSLSLTFLWPNEGETLYAGPPTLVYNVPVSGVVKVSDLTMDQVSIRLDIYQGLEMIDSATTQPEEDGTFAFHVTVNPGGTTEDFPTGLRHCYNCHDPGELEFVPGELLLRLTASTTTGIVETAERRVVVDIAGTAVVPVRVALAENPSIGVEGVYVTGTARLYDWRSRTSKGISDASGTAEVRVEALSQSSSRYIFYVEPTIVEGVLFEGLGSTEVILPAGATAAEPITLLVKRMTGSLRGSLSGSLDSSFPGIELWAVRLPDGQAFPGTVYPSGEFDFGTLPIASYWITSDQVALAHTGLHLEQKVIDLRSPGSSQVRLSVAPLQAEAVFGTVRDQDGYPLPFAWLMSEGDSTAVGVHPTDGSFVMETIPNGVVDLVAVAPGFYSKRLPLASTSKSLSGMDFQLELRPETQVIAWGDGGIFIPGETVATAFSNRISLSRGWLWGRTQMAQPLTIQLGSFQLDFSLGSFALESVPDQTPWLYVLEGTVLVHSGDDLPAVDAGPGQMVALLAGAPLLAVPINTMTVAVFHPAGPLPVSPVWRPTLWQRIGAGIERIGVGGAKIVTYVTYLMIISSILVFPLTGLYSWFKQKVKSKKGEAENHD